MRTKPIAPRSNPNANPDSISRYMTRDQSRRVNSEHALNLASHPPARICISETKIVSGSRFLQQCLSSETREDHRDNPRQEQVFPLYIAAIFLFILRVLQVDFMRSNSSSLTTSVKRWTKLLIGFACFGFSIAFMKQANFGLGPWDVLSDGLAGLTGMQFGTVSIIIGILLLLLWIPIREKPGLATVLNVLLVGAFANVTLAIVQSPGSAFLRSLWFVTGLILAGLGTVLYLGSQLGAGPRDGLMLGLSRRKGWSVSRTRTGLEVLVLILGWVLGGAVGIGTVIFALTIGPTIQFIASKAGQDLARQTVPS